MRLESSVNRVSMARPGRSGRDTRPRHSTRPRRDWFIRGTWLYLPPKAALINIFSVNLAHPSQTKPRMENDYWKSIGDWLVQLFERPFLFLPLFFSLFLLFFFYFSFFSSLFVFPSSLIKASTLYWLSKCSGERVIFGRYFIKSAKRTLLILISPFARCCWLPLLLLLFLRLLIALLLVLKRSLRFVPSIWFASCLVLFCYNEIKYCISGLVASWPFWTFYGLNRLCRL